MIKIKYPWDIEEEEFNEIEFQEAYKEMATEMGLSLDPDDPRHFYDWRALYKEDPTLTPNAEGHFDSKHKKKGHEREFIGGVSTITGKPAPGKSIISFPWDEATRPTKPAMTAKSIEEILSIKDFTSPMDKINFYKEKINWLEGIAKEKGGLSSSSYDAYEYAINQYNKAVKEHNINLPLIQGLPKSLPSDKPLIEGLPISKPEDKPFSLEDIKKGVISVFGTWEAKKKAMPELQKMEDFASEVIKEAVPLAQSRYGEEYSKRGPYKEEVAIIHEYLTGAPRLQTLKKMDANFREYGNINPDVDERSWLEYFKQEGLWKTLITGPTKGIYDEAEKLQYQLSDIRMRVAEPGRDFIGQVGWAGVAIIMGYQGITALYKGGMTIENKVIKGEKLKQAVKRIQDAYIAETGKFKATLSDNDFRIAESLGNITKRYGLEVLTGLTKMEVPQAVFMGQAGNITNLVKMIQSAGKLTPDIANQLKVMNPIETGLVFQQLSMASPAIASKLASQFVDLIPQKITKIPKVEEEMTPEELEQFKKLKVAKIIPKEEVEPTRAELEAIEKPIMPKEKFIGKAFRAETEIPEHGAEIIAKMKTAQEKLNYDASTTGNPIFKEAEELAKSLGIDLNKVPIEEMVWVASDIKTAEKYGEAKEIKLPKDTIILAKDEEGGSLVLKNSEKYIKEVEEPTKAQLEEIEEIEKGEIKPYAIYKKTGLPMTKEELIAKVKERPEKWVKKIEEVEPEPTPEEIRTVFMDKEHLDTTVKEREFFLSKFGKLFTETKTIEDTLLKQKFNEMQMMVEYEEDEIYRLAFAKDKMRVPVTTKTEWMEGLGKTKYMQIFRVDKNLQYPDEVASNLGISENELREQIIERIRTAPEEVTLESAKQALIDEGNAVFLQVDAQMDAYRILLDEIEGGEYSFDTPKNIKRLNAKISALKSDSKKLMTQYEEKITALQKEGIEKRFEELKKVTEAEKKVEVEIGVKKGVKEVFAARRLKGLPKEEYKKGNVIMGQIHKAVHLKGLTDKEYTALKRKYGYSPHLATATKRMSIPQLEAVLKAVNRARPKIIGHKTVIKLKTENKIQSLKENLMDKLQMSEEKYQEVLKDVGVYKEPKYIDGKHFITETKGKDIIYRLIDEANILRSTLPYDKAVEEHPVIKKFIDREKAIIGRYRDRTMKDPREWNSMRVYAQKAEEITGAPVYRLYQDLIDVSLENKEKLGLFIREFEPNKKIMKDLEALKRVTHYVGSKSTLKDKPAYPKDITNEEIELAKKVEDMLIDYRARARTEKFLDNVENPEKMPQYIQYKKEIDKAKDIYESKGYDDLVEYMKTQVWGIIRNGYDPDQVWSPKIRMYKPAPQTFGKHNIKVRTDIEYHEQDRNIVERLFTYKKSMDNLVEMRPIVRAFITLMDQNLDKFKDPKRVQEVMEIFLRELKGYNRPEGLVERILNRAYAQAMQVIIMPSIVMFGRNCLQNLAFGYDKTIIIDPRNKKLSEGRIKYMNTYISQLQSMKVDWFMIGEKPLGGKIGAFLIKMVNKVGIYPYSDEGNRHLGFWGKINQVDRGFKGIDAKSTEKQISKAMRKAKFDDIERTERIMALEILANDGYEDMARYVSRCYVADTEFQYNRAERSPMEMGRGKWLSNLMLFPRSYWEMLLKMGNKFKTGNPRQKARAFKVLVSIIVGGLIVGEGYKKVTGRRQNPYNPLKLLAYEPGGLAIGTVEAFSDVITNTILVLNGDEKAATTLATAIPRLSDMMIPFYDYTLRAIEATVPMTYRGQHVNKRIDVLALRVLRKLVTDRMRELGWNVKGYKPSAKGYYVERNFYQKLQYVIAGAGVDIGIKEALKGVAVPSVKYEWEKTKTETKKIIKFDWE